MIWPLLGSFVKTSSFGYRSSPYREGHPSEFHGGLDLGQKSGSPVVSPEDGIVVFSRWASDCVGNTITIWHPSLFMWSQYHHLTDRVVFEGARVTRGQLIGHLGATGYCVTGPHLHYNLISPSTTGRGGTYIDPAAMMADGTVIRDPRGEGRAWWIVPPTTSATATTSIASTSSPSHKSPPRRAVASASSPAKASGAAAGVILLALLLTGALT